MIRSALKRFARHRTGNVAVVFALVLVPMLGFTGLATDYAKSLLVKRRLELAIDSASLAAVRKTIDIINEGTRSAAEAVSAGEEEGKAYLLSQSNRIMDSELDVAKITVTVNGGDVSSQADYSAKVPTVFARLFAVDQFRVQGTAGASSTLPPYVDVHVLVDISQSMGIGATKADQEGIRTMDVRRFNHSNGTSSVGQNGCAFGCHIVQSEFKSNDTRYPTLSTYEMARNNGYRMRIDVVRDAVSKLATSLLDHESKRYRVAIHTFNTSFQTLVPPTESLSTISTALSGLHLSTREGGTNAHVALGKLDDVIPAPGDGLTQAKAKAITVMMTDGTEDNQMEFPEFDGIRHDQTFVNFEPSASDWGGRVQSFDPRICNPLKNKGVRLIALNTKYLIPENTSNPKFDAIRDWLHTYIDTNMAKCVSSQSDYYDASSPADVDRATTQIVTSISRPLALVR